MKNIFYPIIGTLLFLPYWASAQVSTTTAPGGEQRDFFDLPEAVPPSELIDIMYRFGLGIGAFIAFAWIVFAGFRYATSGDNPSVRSDARDRITQALIGLLLLIGATALLNIINPRLTNLVDPKLLKVDIPDNTAGIDVPNEEIDPSQFPPLEGDAAAMEGDVRAELAAAGITVNKGACPPGIPYQRYPGGCTSVGGLQPKAIEYVKFLKSNCSCDVVITGGSEAGHASGLQSHGTGWKIDIRDTAPGVQAYVTSQIAEGDFKSGGRRGGRHGGPRVYDINSSGQRVATWVNEGSHWDIAVFNYDFE